MKNTLRNIVIGWIDGLTVPFALATGLYATGTASAFIFKICLIVAAAGAITMAAGGYLSGKKYIPGGSSFAAACMIGLGYLSGGLLSVAPYYCAGTPSEAFRYAAVLVGTGLLAGGYLDSALNGANGITGALRITFTALVAALAAYGVGLLFTG